MNPNFELSRKTRALIDLFVRMSLKQTMTFAAASREVGFPIESTTAAYASARKIAERDHRVFIATCRGIGFMRGDGLDMANSGEGFALSIRRKAKRGAARMELALTQNLTRSQEMRASELFNRFSIIRSTAEPSRTRSNRPAVPAVPMAE